MTTYPRRRGPLRGVDATDRTQWPRKGATALVSAALVSAALLAAATLGGCEIDEPKTDAPPARTTEAAGASGPTPEPPSVAGTWTDQAAATAALEAFAAQLAAVGQYRVDRNERVYFDGEFLGTNISHLVDVTARRVRSDQTFEVSEEALWAQLSPDPARPDLARTVELRVITDYAGSSPHAYLTYLGANGWDGEWIEAGPGVPLPAELGAAAAELVAAAAPTVHARGLLDVIALEPTGFNPGLSALEFTVPASIGAGFVPYGTAVTIAAAGVDLRSLPAAATARVFAIAGGLRMVVEVSQLLRAARDRIDDQAVTTQLDTIDAAVDLKVYVLGTAERIDLPDPAAIVADVPAR